MHLFLKFPGINFCQDMSLFNKAVLSMIFQIAEDFYSDSTHHVGISSLPFHWFIMHTWLTAASTKPGFCFLLTLIVKNTVHLDDGDILLQQVESCSNVGLHVSEKLQVSDQLPQWKNPSVHSICYKMIFCEKIRRSLITNHIRQYSEKNRKSQTNFLSGRIHQSTASVIIKMIFCETTIK